MNPIALYVLLIFCASNCQPDHWPPETGALVFTSFADCQTEAKELDAFEKQVRYVDEKGKPAPHPRGWHHICARSYFADYGQTERLTDGRVTCSYLTKMPEAVMARRLDPYQPQHHCSSHKP